MIAAVSTRFRQSLGGMTFPDFEGHIALRAFVSKLLTSLANLQKATEFHLALSVHLAGCRHD